MTLPMPNLIADPPELRETHTRSASQHARLARDVSEQLLQRYRAMRSRASALANTPAPASGNPLQPIESPPALGYGDPDAPVAALDGGPECVPCGNKRFILDANGALHACPHCGVALSWRNKALAPYSSHAGRAEHQTFDNFRVSGHADGRINASLAQCLEAARRFAESPSGWLVIYGSSGNGKSHLCGAAYHWLCGGQRSGQAIFVTMPDLLESLKALMDGGGERESYSARLQKYQAAPILIVDDIGAEKRSEWSESVLFQVVDFRYRNRLPAFFVTNLNPFDKEAFDPRVVDRWTDTEFSTVIANTAPSYRQRR